MVCMSTYNANEPKDAKSKDERIVRLAIVIGYAYACVLEEVSLPTIESMSCRADVEQHHLWKAFNEPVTSDDLQILLRDVN